MMNTNRTSETGTGRKTPVICYILLFTLTVVLCTYFFSRSLHYHTYTVTDGTNQTTITSESTNPRDVITEAGFTLDTADSYTVTKNTTLSTIEISRAKTVTVSYDGKAVRTDVTSDTVGSVISMLNIPLEDSDTITSDGAAVTTDTTVYDGMCLDISSSRELIDTTLLRTPYETVTKEDATLAAGETVVETEGTDGVLQLTTSNVVVNGEVQSSTVLSAITLSDPVTEVVRVGTAAQITEDDDDSAEIQEEDAAVQTEEEENEAASEETDTADNDSAAPSEPAATETTDSTASQSVYLADNTSSTTTTETAKTETPAPEPEAEAEPELEPEPETAAPVEDTPTEQEVPEETVEAPASSGNTITTSDGTVLSYSSVMTVTATAYTGGGTTATGTAARYGEIAVDPSVIPYGTRMYIMTSDGSWVYGVATAEDCGGAIKGNIIDLYFSDYNTCIQFGRRTCTVYILN